MRTPTMTDARGRTIHARYHIPAGSSVRVRGHDGNWRDHQTWADLYFVEPNTTGYNGALLYFEEAGWLIEVRRDAVVDV